MATSLSKSITILTAAYRSPAFIQVVEDHLAYIVRTGKYTDVNVDPAVALKYAGDFLGLLTYLGIPANNHYINTRLTGLSNPTDFTGENVNIRVVDQSYYTLFVNTWRAHSRQNKKAA